MEKIKNCLEKIIMSLDFIKGINQFLQLIFFRFFDRKNYDNLMEFAFEDKRLKLKNEEVKLRKSEFELYKEFKSFNDKIQDKFPFQNQESNDKDFEFKCKFCNIPLMPDTNNNLTNYYCIKCDTHYLHNSTNI